MGIIPNEITASQELQKNTKERKEETAGVGGAQRGSSDDERYEEVVREGREGEGRALR